MWAYSGPTNPDCVLPEELPKDEVWSRLDRVLQLKDKESLEGKPGPLHATKLSNLVCSPFYSMAFFPLLSFVLTSSCPFRRGSRAINPGRIFREGRKAWLGKPPRGRPRLPRRRRKP